MKKKQVQHLFNFTLNLIQKDIGIGETDNIQLQKYIDKIGLSKFLGIYAWDTIPTMINNQSCIVNLDKSTESGSHWISLYKYKNKIYMYDSFNRKISDFRKVDIDKNMYQKNRQTDCGQRSIAFLTLVQIIGLYDTLKL